MSKHVAVMAASPGRLGGVPVQGFVTVPGVGSAFGDDGNLSDEMVWKGLDALAFRLVKATDKALCTASHGSSAET
ncbi:hypothetical protein [Nisaea sp.]|uniref:hypothetical protein n=1 Tax=Nisaea sp. TaxID=2024842 RepID=UPI003264A937